MGPKFIAKVEDVKKLLSDADGYYNSGRYDLAFKRYEQVLNLDPYNIAARKGEEKVNLARDNSALAPSISRNVSSVAFTAASIK